MEIGDVFGDLPTVETDRLVLRKLALSDAEDLYGFTSVPEVSEYLTWECHKSIETTIKFLESVLDKYSNKEVSQWGIELKDTHKLIGISGFIGWCPEHSKAEIAYVLSNKYWNRGLMTEALEAVVDFGFEVMDLNRLEAKVEVGNISSEKVLQKLGMVHEGTLRKFTYVKGEFKDYELYAILRDEYFGKKTSRRRWNTSKRKK